MPSYSRLCFRFFGDTIKPFRKYFLDLKNDLQIAGLNFTLDEYLSMALFTFLLAFCLETIILSFIFGLFFNIFIAVLLSITLSFSLSAVIFFLFYSYPATLSKKKGDDIDKVLPFAVSYLSALSSGNIPPYYLFRTLSNFSEYREVTKAAYNITRNIKMFGMNFTDAIKRESTRTASKNFKELLYGINTTISTGGDLRTFLREKSDLLMADYRRRIRKYSQDLSLFVEIYLTLIITGSIFFIVLTSIMAGTGGLEIISIQSFIVFIFLPFVSVAFLVLVRLRSPVS